MSGTTVKQIWEAFRGSENAFRYYGDVVIEVIRRLNRGANATVDLNPDVARAINDFPTCCHDCTTPPWCMYPPRDLADDVSQLARLATALSDAAAALVRELPAGTDEIYVYGTAMPGIYWAETGRSR